MGIDNYFDQLQRMSSDRGIDLMHAFAAAGYPNSTYYRNLNGTFHLRYETATRVAEIILRA